jgi:glycosyltransferase involved in cell wall biosynthesis
MRAVGSVLSQTYRDIEVVVVIDGPDPATRAAIGSINDCRLRVLELSESGGSANARNAGVQHAKGEWVALLDDDDEWLPHKIERQLDCAIHSKLTHPFVACRVIGRTPRRDYIWPRRFPGDDELLIDYLFARNSLFRGEGQIPTCAIFAERQLLLSVPFTRGMSHNDDTDWLVRISAREDIRVEFVDEPLAVWYLEETRSCVSMQNDWRRAHAWLNSVRDLITPRAYAGFIATNIAGEAGRQHAWTAFFPLLSDMCFCGGVKPIDLALYLGNWAMPESLRSSIRSRLYRKIEEDPA